MDINFFNDYMKILLKSGYRDADLFKDKFIPNRLYKYFPPDHNRLEALISNKLWLAQYDTFEDKHEFSFLQINKNYFENHESLHNINFSTASQWLDSNKHLVSISCFTTSFQNSDFWKKYAANYTGYCVEYPVVRKQLLYPVIYTDKNIDISEYACNFIAKIYDTILKEKELEAEWNRPVNLIPDEDIDNISFIYFNYCAKEPDWSWENEFRIVFSNEHPQTEPGQLVSYECLGIKPINIYFYPQKCNPDVIPMLKQIRNDNFSSISLE